MPDKTDPHHRIDMMERSNERLEANITATLEGFRKDMADMRTDMEKRFGDMSTSIGKLETHVGWIKVLVVVMIALELRELFLP